MANIKAKLPPIDYRLMARVIFEIYYPRTEVK